MTTVEEWQRCRRAEESSRDELTFHVRMLTPTRHRIVMRHPACGYELSFRETGPALTWTDIEAAAATHLPEHAEAPEVPVGPDPISEQVHLDAARAHVAQTFTGVSLSQPQEVEFDDLAAMVARRPEHRAAVESAYRAGERRIPAEPGPEVLAVRVVETGQRWERRYAKDQPDRWAGGQWLVEWSQVLGWAAGRELVDATHDLGQDGGER